MSASNACFDPWILASPEALAETLARLEAEDAASLPFLADDGRRHLLAATEGLAYREARPMIGKGERAVYQEFEICMNPPAPSPFHGCAAALERLLRAALEQLPTPPLAAAPRLNDVVVQRYPPGALGITPHRDHVRYRELVAIVTLAGQARFGVCKERSAAEARDVPIPPGSLLLMRAPGFAGREDRPFHFVSDVVEARICLGLRHDLRPGEPV
jgi:hypothetical protein